MRIRGSRLREVVGAALVMGVALMTVTGCVADARPTATPTVDPAPHFDGPWAAEFAQAYASTSSDSLDRKILRTGQVTDQDYAAVSNAFVTCMAGKGFHAVITGPSGAGEVTNATPQNQDAVQAAEKICDPPFAVISALRGAILANPEHLNENDIVTACLVKKRLVPPSYTAKDYASDLATQKFPFDINSPTFMSCTADPLGLQSGK